jgi:hypothetical protein
MNEADWLGRETLVGPNPLSPLSWLRDQHNDRRMFLFLAAYLPRFMYGRFCPACHLTPTLFERHAEKPLSADDWRRVMLGSHAGVDGGSACVARPVVRRTLNYLRGIVCPAEFWNGLFQTHTEVVFQLRQENSGDAGWVESFRISTDEAYREGMNLLKDIVGNPYREVFFSPL